ncbi:unnamed protein product [Arctia plantaginis]|uniref:Uncharacterized protein n=1 Tax=Arctia plantaginis TaxID=874455 RepID=A0A8S0Z440_ARCPL|nr:unnamed protein product [Arctia plantaginis]
MRSFLFLVFFIYSANSSSAPFIKKCKGGDKKCLKEAIQKAIPVLAIGQKELGIETLDPIFIKSLNASSNGLSLQFQDISGTGLKDCVVKKAKHDVSKLKLKIKLQCTVEFRGQFEMNGKLLLLPMEGKGDGRVILRKFVVSVESDLGEINCSDGQKHWTVKDYKYSYDLKDKPTIELRNVFNGNEVISQTINEFINTSNDKLVKDIGPPLFEVVLKKVVENINKFFKQVPVSDLTLDSTE